MDSYLVVVERRDDSKFVAEVEEVPDCRCTGPTVNEVLHEAEQKLRQHLSGAPSSRRRRDRDRAAYDGLRRAARNNVVAAACIRPRGV